MTTKEQDDQAMAEDQAFIQSLYDDLDLENTDTNAKANATFEHPSEALDRRILETAHKAVTDKSALLQNDAIDTKNKPKNDNVKTLPIPTKTGKKIPWYFSIATAASVLLMVTIVNNQLSGPINPIYDTPSVSADSMINSKQIGTSQTSELVMAESILNESESAFADSQPVLMEAEDVFAYDNELPLKNDHRAQEVEQKSEQTILSTTTQSKAQIIKKDTLDIASAPQRLLAKKVEADVESQLSNNLASAMHEERTLKEKKSKQSLSRSETQKISIENNQLSTKKENYILTSVNLSDEKYKLLRAESNQIPLYWLLKQENENSYIIELLTTGQAPVFYLLNKDSYQLNNIIVNKRYDFSEITSLSKEIKNIE